LTSRSARLSHGFFRRPRGFVDWPQAGTVLPRGPVHLLGWCLFPGGSVSHVEVSVAGRPPERARIAMERRDIPLHSRHPDAPIAAFEHKCDLTDLPADVESVRVEARAVSLDGRELRLTAAEYAVAAPQPHFRDRDGNARELRGRSLRALGPRRRARRPGVRVLAFAHMLVHGGGSLYLLELLRRIAHDPGFHCEVVSLADGPLREEFERAGIPVHITDGFPVTSVARYEGSVAQLVAWVGAGEFDVALVNTLGSFIGADVAARLGIPAVWAVHESFPLPMFWSAAYAPGALHPYVREQAEQAFGSAAAVLFEAEATRELFLPYAPPERLLTRPYGIELEALDASSEAHPRARARRRLGIADDARVILCLGSIEARKAQAMLAQAFAQVADRHPHAQLILVGETDDAYCADYRDSLHEYVERAGLGRRVRIEPVTDEPYLWHAVADVLVCASDIESLPRVIMEAMALGTPVLSTRVFGVPELIEDSRTGYLCDVRDLGALAAGLDRVLGASDAELRAVAEAASARVRERHDPAAYARQVVDLLRSVADDPEAVPVEEALEA
jgi:D-inositol-3-phosphate glycosyltransferase